MHDHATYNFQLSFGPETLSVLGRALDSALQEAKGCRGLDGLGAYNLHHILARRILRSALSGERDPIRLHDAALSDIRALRTISIG